MEVIRNFDLGAKQNGGGILCTGKGRFTRYDFCRMRQRLTTGPRHDLRLLCTSEKCRSILKHFLKRCDNRKSCRRPVVNLSHATKIVPCKSALRVPDCLP